MKNIRLEFDNEFVVSLVFFCLLPRKTIIESNFVWKKRLVSFFGKVNFVFFFFYIFNNVILRRVPHISIKF